VARAAAPKIVVETKGVEKAELNLRELGVRAKDIRPLTRDLSRIFEHSTKKRFEGSAHWPPLAESTLERKSAEGLDHGILRATDSLYKSLTNPGDKNAVRKGKPGEFVFGTKLRHGRFAKGTKTQPKRELINLTAQERREAAKTISSYITTGRPK